MPEYEAEELTAEGRDGGYPIGARVKSRVFELDCYLEMPCYISRRFI